MHENPIVNITFQVNIMAQVDTILLSKVMVMVMVHALV